MTSLCAVVPVFDHERAVGATTAGLRAHGLTVLLVDDGSGPACADELRRLAAADPEVRLLRLPENRGKGAAVLAGLKAAAAAGFTHALQIDADVELLVARIARRAAEEGRSDDTEEVVRKRMQIYAEQTAPVVDHYARKGLLTRVLGEGSIEEVFQRIRGVLQIRSS